MSVGQSGKLSWDSAIKGKALVVRMAGKITEDTHLNQVLIDLMIAGDNKFDSIYFDLRGVQQINSPGVRDWLLFMERVQAKYMIRFLSIGECFVEQASMIPTLLGKAGTPVDTFDAPYLCERCNTKQVILMKTKDVLDASGSGEITAPAAKCQKCGQPLEFDAYEDEFFQFIRHAAYVR
jgi:hypothetical protein